MKGLYIAPVDCKANEFIGVYKKIQYQIEALKDLSVKMDYIGIEGNYISFIDKKQRVNLERAKHYIFFRYIMKNISTIINEYDFVYIRFSFANPYMFSVAKKMMKNNVKVFIEIPTYPYKFEIPNTIKNIILKQVDSVLWYLGKKYITNLVLTNDIQKLFGVRAINIFNGISKNDIRIRKVPKLDDEINLIAVANLSKWHGYDRIIEGMYNYYAENPRIKVNFFVIGEGLEKVNLENLSKKLDLQEYVSFLGARFADELEELYDKSSIGVSSLALFRAGGGHDPIKSKEYIAKGIPVIIGYNDRALEEDLKFVFRVPSDNTPININDILEKYYSMNLSSDDIKEYALKNLTWESQMKKVLNCIVNRRVN